MKKIILISLIFLAVLISWSYVLIFKPINQNSKTEATLLIQQGETVNQIAQKLKELEIIRNESAFYFYTRYKNLDQKIKSGRFTINQTQNVPQILQIITNARLSEGFITIPEGMTIQDIDQKLSALGYLNSGDFLNSAINFQSWTNYDFLDQDKNQQVPIPLEGFIFPDTYFIESQNFDPQSLIFKGLDNFAQKLQKIDLQSSEIYQNYSLHEIITMASIIENEVKSSNDRKIVSGILWKRLENNWTIGADAALLYLKSNRKIDQRELLEDSPYNIRKNKGLPPGPISNPGLDSTNAALFPEKTGYWFYLSAQNGDTIFAETNEEHNLNRAKYL